MSTATIDPATAVVPQQVRASTVTWTRVLRAVYAVSAFVLVAVIWELVKVLVPTNGVSIGGTRILPRTSDGALPHVWAVFTVLGEADGKGTVGGTLLRTGLFTLGLSLLALLLGAVVGVILAVAMQRFGWLERGLLPYVVLSQTVPLIALAPLVAAWGGKLSIGGEPWRPWMSIVVIAAYLAFFPIAIGMLRGLQAPSTASVELMRSCSAGWWATRSSWPGSPTATWHFGSTPARTRRWPPSPRSTACRRRRAAAA